jgi:hypothetical protein
MISLPGRRVSKKRSWREQRVFNRRVGEQKSFVDWSWRKGWKLRAPGPLNFLVYITEPLSEERKQ